VVFFFLQLAVALQKPFNMKKVFFLTLLISFGNAINAQVGINVTGAPPAASAMLDVSSSSKGVLIPQVSIDSLKDVTSIPSPANGLIVYNTTQPGVRNDMARGFYYYSTNALSWIRLADNFNDNKWKDGGLLGIQLRDTTDGVEIMDGYTGTSTNYGPKVKMLKKIDSALLNSKNNIPVLVLTGVNSGKDVAGWDSLQKTSIIFEMNYLTRSGASATANNVAISSYINRGTGTTQTTQTQGLGFYVTAPPHNTATADTPSMAMFRHNVGIGAYPTDINNVTEGRLQITGFSNGDQLSLRHPSSINLKWGLYVSSIDSSLNFYSNGSLRSNIDRVTGVYSALSDRTRKKNILPLNNVLQSIRKLPVYYYNYIDSKDSDRRMIGLMAQDVQLHFPELVYQRYDREITKPVLTMDYSGFGVLAIKAIQEQQIVIDDLRAKDEKQQALIMELLKRVEALEKKN
jgi:Chaperone of endosialidase